MKWGIVAFRQDISGSIKVKSVAATTTIIGDATCRFGAARNFARVDETICLVDTLFAHGASATVPRAFALLAYNGTNAFDNFILVGWIDTIQIRVALSWQSASPSSTVRLGVLCHESLRPDIISFVQSVPNVNVAFLIGGARRRRPHCCVSVANLTALGIKVNHITIVTIVVDAGYGAFTVLDPAHDGWTKEILYIGIRLAKRVTTSLGTLVVLAFQISNAVI